MSMTPDMMTAEQWREVADSLEKGLGHAAAEHATLRARLTEVEAENERLREAARIVCAAPPASREAFKGSQQDWRDYLGARAILAQPKEPEHD